MRTIIDQTLKSETVLDTLLKKSVLEADSTTREIVKSISQRHVSTVPGKEEQKAHTLQHKFRNCLNVSTGDATMLLVDMLSLSGAM
jgi:hypothetical protein